MTWWLKSYHSQGTAARGGASLLSDTAPFCSVQQFLLILFVGFFSVCQNCSFIDELIYPLLGEQGRSAVWGSRWCRWIRKCCFCSLMHCLTLSRYLCSCFFNYEVGGPILTDLKSTVEFGVVSMELLLYSWPDWKMFSIPSFTFYLEKSPSISGFPPLPSQYFLLKFLMRKSCISPNCLIEVENCLLPWIKFQIFTLSIYMDLNLPELSCP